MYVKKMFLVMAITLTAVGVKGQSNEELTKLYQDSYGRAMKYNDRFEAKSILYQLIALDPQNDSLLVNLAFLYIEAGQNASCVMACIDALAINPQNTGALEITAVAYKNLGLKDKSLEAYEDLMLLTDNFEVLYKMAFLQYELGKYQQSVTNIDILLERPEAAETTVFITIDEEQKEFPIQAALYNLKGLVDKELGDFDAAKSNYQEALRLAPDFSLAESNLAELEQN